MKKRSATLARIRKVELVLLASAGVAALVGHFNQHGNLYLGGWAGRFLQDYYATISMGLASIAITVLIADILHQHRDTEREKRNLILQMGSPDNPSAKEAVRIS